MFSIPTASTDLPSVSYSERIVGYGASGSVILLNRDLERERVTENIPGDRDTVTTAQTIAPEDIWIDTLEVAGEVRSLPLEQDGSRIRLTLPPDSLTALALDRLAN